MGTHYRLQCDIPQVIAWNDLSEEFWGYGDFTQTSQIDQANEKVEKALRTSFYLETAKFYQDIPAIQYNLEYLDYGKPLPIYLHTKDLIKSCKMHKIADLLNAQNELDQLEKKTYRFSLFKEISKTRDQKQTEKLKEKIDTLESRFNNQLDFLENLKDYSKHIGKEIDGIKLYPGVLSLS